MFDRANHVHRNAASSQGARASRCVRLAVVCLAVVLSGGCSSTHVAPSELAARLQFSAVELRGTEFVHRAYYAGLRDSPAAPLWVFIEGDGRPWIGGREPAGDPTSRNPLALRLAAATGKPVLYLNRPCYDGHASDPACGAELWTSARYSERVVQSMSAALRTFLSQHGFDEIVLVGYSGGGALSALMAPRLANVRTLVTIAANLDVAAWTAHHGYLPLDASLNPADRDEASAATEIHLVGALDATVPPQTSRRYFERRPQAAVWEYSRFDHVCCWVREWPSIVARIEAAMNRAP